MMIYLYIALGLWLVWVLGHLAAMYFAKPDTPCFTGFQIIMPDRYAELLTVSEYVAVYAHESGHRHHLHVWKNFVRVCLFRRPSQVQLRQQEIEADNFAADIVGPRDLASALRKIGATDPFDQWRIQRLEGAAT